MQWTAWRLCEGSLLKMIRAVVIADDDSLVGKLNEQDASILISLGDLWNSTIEQAATRYSCEQVLAVRGNHDTAGEYPYGVRSLHLSVFSYGGITFGGFDGSWKYKPRGHHLYEQCEVSAALESFPSVDVFIAHNSPAGVHERDDNIHQGFEAFGSYISRAQPKLFLHGHQHLNLESQIGNTRVVGVFGEQVITLPERVNRVI